MSSYQNDMIHFHWLIHCIKPIILVSARRRQALYIQEDTCKLQYKVYLYTIQWLNLPQYQGGVHLVPREINREEEGERERAHPDITKPTLGHHIIIYLCTRQLAWRYRRLSERVTHAFLTLFLSISPPHLSFSKQLQKSNSRRGRERRCLPCDVSVCLCILDVSLAHTNKLLLCLFCLWPLLIFVNCDINIYIIFIISHTTTLQKR